MTFIGFIENETDRAILFQDHYWEESGWFPKSQIDVLREEDTHEVRILASPWICDKKRLHEFKFIRKAEPEPQGPGPDEPF